MVLVALVALTRALIFVAWVAALLGGDDHQNTLGAVADDDLVTDVVLVNAWANLLEISEAGCIGCGGFDLDHI